VRSAIGEFDIVGLKRDGKWNWIFDRTQSRAIIKVIKVGALERQSGNGRENYGIPVKTVKAGSRKGYRENLVPGKMVHMKAIKALTQSTAGVPTAARPQSTAVGNDLFKKFLLSFNCGSPRQ